jgi:hypothetical protein
MSLAGGEVGDDQDEKGNKGCPAQANLNGLFHNKTISGDIKVLQFAG